MSTGARRRVANDQAKRVGCRCGATVMRVPVAGSMVDVDPDPDPEGEIGAAPVNGQWKFGPAETARGPVRRYRRHDCPATTPAAVLDRQAHVTRGTEGPCARYCGARVPRRYGPHAVILCPACSPDPDGDDESPTET